MKATLRHSTYYLRHRMRAEPVNKRRIYEKALTAWREAHPEAGEAEQRAAAGRIARACGV